MKLQIILKCLLNQIIMKMIYLKHAFVVKFLNKLLKNLHNIKIDNILSSYYFYMVSHTFKHKIVENELISFVNNALKCNNCLS